MRIRRIPAVFARSAAAAALLACGAADGLAATPREQVEERRRTNPHVIVDVITGEQLTGTIERTAENDFYLADKSGIDRILVPYTAVRALIDPQTGERMTLDPTTRPAAGAAAAETTVPAGRSRMLALTGGAVGAALVFWVVASRFRRS